MAIDSTIPVWSFDPNWRGDVAETLEWLTDVLTSPTGREQRRALRAFPRRYLEFDVTVTGAARNYFDHMVGLHGARNWYLPLWYDPHPLTALAAVGATTLTLTGMADSTLEAGQIAYISNLQTPFEHELVEVAAVSSTGITLMNPTTQVWRPGAIVYPVTTAKLIEQPRLNRLAASVQETTVKFRLVSPEDDGDVAVSDNVGPLIVDGLLVETYHREYGRLGFVHHHAGTADGQFIFIHALFRAYDVMKTGSAAEREVADYYRQLALDMLDAIGGGSNGPIFRQALPTSNTVISLPNAVFAARGDVPVQGVSYTYQVTPVAGVLTIFEAAHGGEVYDVWQIYPSTSALKYSGAFSPAVDIASPAGDTNIEIDVDHWLRSGLTTKVTIPAGSPTAATWKIAYSYESSTAIPITEGFVAYPSWSVLPDGYAVSSLETYRWFEQAMERAIADDPRPEKVAIWTGLRASVRRSVVKARDLGDQRNIFRPLPGFPVIPTRGEPSGVYCASSHSEAAAPLTPGANRLWRGYDFWSRASNGDILATVPAPEDAALNYVQIGRKFDDQWRSSSVYQAADQYLYVSMSMNKKPTLSSKERCLIYLASTDALDATHTWYADIGQYSAFVPKTDGSVIEFLVPRTDFKLRSFDSSGDTVWGTTIPSDTAIVKAGVSVEMTQSFSLRLRTMRLVSGASTSWVTSNLATAVKGSPIPYQPAAVPFSVSADLSRQTLLGWNGMPFHGQQLPDQWWWLSSDIDAVFPSLIASALPAADITTGAITYPISTTDSAGNVKSKRALLMEQQLLMLKAAQDRYHADGGDLGPFAHTFVVNTSDRSKIGSPTPHSWAYANENPNTRWGGYQGRIVESLAKLLDVTSGAAGFATARSIALTLVTNWLAWVEGYWPEINLNGLTNKSGSISLTNKAGDIVLTARLADNLGPPTDYPNPTLSDPIAKFEDPHTSALILRACLWLEKRGLGSHAVNQALMTRAWYHLESTWRTNGAMAFTWSPEGFRWFGSWHGEILHTLAEMVDNALVLPAEINISSVRARLIATRTWLEGTGVRTANGGTVDGLTDIYRGYSVLKTEPDESENLTSEFERIVDELDNRTSSPYQVDTADRSFETQQHRWFLRGRAEHRSIRQMFYGLQGRARTLWLPTFADDFVLVEDISAGDQAITVALAGFTLTGGPKADREHVRILFSDGTCIYRQIVESAQGSTTEVLGFDRPIQRNAALSEVVQVCFIRLARLSQDSIDISHVTDIEGVSTVSAIFRTAPDDRRATPTN